MRHIYRCSRRPAETPGGEPPSLAEPLRRFCENTISAVEPARAQVTIENELGLHARPAMTFVELANQYVSNIYLNKAGEPVDAKSIMHVMTLGATQGTALEITAEGEDADEAVAALQKLVERRFDEP